VFVGHRYHLVWHVVPRRKHGRPLVENNLSFSTPTLVSEVMRMRMLRWHNPRTGSSPIDYLALCSTLQGHLIQPQWPNTDDMAVSGVFSHRRQTPQQHHQQCGVRWHQTAEGSRAEDGDLRAARIYASVVKLTFTHRHICRL